MSNIKESKKVNFAPALIGLFLFLRAIFLTGRRSLGLEDFYNFDVSFSNENIALIVLYLLFAVFASLVIAKLGKKFGNAVSYISVLLVAEPLFFVKQVDCIALFITVLGLVFILNGLRDKPVVPNEVTLIVFLIVSCVLAENALYVFVAPALMAYFIGDIENTFKRTKKIVMLIFSVVSIGGGVLVNDFLSEKYPAFDSFIETYSFFENVYFKHLDYENVLLFVFLIPTLIFGVIFFVDMFKGNDENSSLASYISLGVVVCAYILSIVGFILGGSDNFYTANYLIPIAIVAMINSKNSEAEKSLKKANGIIGKYALVFVAVLVVLCFVAVRVFYEDVDNIAGFVLTI